jgi:uncharacterized protein (DUF736 family)
MAFVQREMSGSLFPNDRKEKDTHPDFKGTALINGVTYEIGAWNKKSGNGKEFTSLSFKVKSAVYDVSGTYPAQHSQGYQNPNPTYGASSKPPEADPNELPF